MSDQLALIPEKPPTLTPITTFIYDFRIGPHPPLDPQFIQNVRRFGVMQPPVVRLREGLGYDVVDGRRRAATLKLLIEDKTLPYNTQVPAMLLEGDCSPDVLALMLNEQRSNNPVSDLAAIEKLVAAGAEIKDICAATGLGRGTVEKRMRLKRLLLSFRYAFDEGKLPVSIAERLAGLPTDLQGDLFIHFAETGKITHGNINEIRYAQQQTALATLPSTIFDGTPEDATGPIEYEIITEGFPCVDASTTVFTGSPHPGESFYLWAQKLIATILVASPSDAPRSATDALGFAATIFSEIGEAQVPGFLADDEKVDLSDIVPIDDAPYDEEYSEEHVDAA